MYMLLLRMHGEQQVKGGNGMAHGLQHGNTVGTQAKSRSCSTRPPCSYPTLDACGTSSLQFRGIVTHVLPLCRCAGAGAGRHGG